MYWIVATLEMAAWGFLAYRLHAVLGWEGVAAIGVLVVLGLIRHERRREIVDRFVVGAVHTERVLRGLIWAHCDPARHDALLDEDAHRKSMDGVAATYERLGRGPYNYADEVKPLAERVRGSWEAMVSATGGEPLVPEVPAAATGAGEAKR